MKPVSVLITCLTILSTAAACAPKSDSSSAPAAASANVPQPAAEVSAEEAERAAQDAETARYADAIDREIAEIEAGYQRSQKTIDDTMDVVAAGGQPVWSRYSEP